MACIISSIDLLYLMETYWFRWIILFFLFAHFTLAFDIQERERSSVLLIALEILRNSAPVLP